MSGDNLAFIVERFTPAVIGRSVIANRLGKDLMIYISKPSIPEMTKVFADTLSIHFKIEERNGSARRSSHKNYQVVFNKYLSYTRSLNNRKDVKVDIFEGKSSSIRIWQDA